MNAALSSFAAGWTQQMVKTNTLAHNPSLASAPNNWTVVGENVGDGVSVDAISQGFVNSSHHYANMMDPRFNLIGISVMVDASGRMWTTHDFEQVGAAAPARPPPPPGPPPAPAGGPPPPGGGGGPPPPPGPPPQPPPPPPRPGPPGPPPPPPGPRGPPPPPPRSGPPPRSFLRPPPRPP